MAQQVPDGAFRLVLSGPEHTRGPGPVVKVDEGHHNFHTLGGGYCILGRLLRGGRLPGGPHARRFEPNSLAGTDVLVIANALNQWNEDDWNTPQPLRLRQQR